MTFFEAFRTHVLADSALATKVKKVAPIVLPETLTMDDFPAMEVKRLSGSSISTLQSAMGINRVRIQVTHWSTDVTESEKAIARLMVLFDQFSGLLGGEGGVKFKVGCFAGPRSVYGGSGNRMMGTQLDLIGLLDESTIS